VILIYRPFLIGVAGASSDMVDHSLQQQLASLKQQQQLQQQILLHQYQQQRQQLEQEHEKQMQEHIKVSVIKTQFDSS
jgi:hypothetical protein